MKRRIMAAAGAVLLLALALWTVGRVLFTQHVDQQIEATVYRDGEAVGKTMVSMLGEKTRYPFQVDSFEGEFRIPWIEKTDVDGLQTEIRWHSSDHMQTIRHSYGGEIFYPHERGIVYFLLISDDMREFALMTTGQDVIATSFAAYQLCADHISSDGGSKASVTDIDEIPALGSE